MTGSDPLPFHRRRALIGTAVGVFLAMLLLGVGVDSVPVGMALSSGLKLEPVGGFVHRFKTWIGAAILMVAAIVLFTWDYPAMMVVIWTAVIVLIGFAIRAFLDTTMLLPRQ
ncbi:hypothetical protein [Streptomyces sp. NPDC020817]|uniref:hypothetical protein n=1 Tax=Streptomyces sp. NPDC020817 TaxID=3365095 RepID=UPI0037BC80F8